MQKLMVAVKQVKVAPHSELARPAEPATSDSQRRLLRSSSINDTGVVFAPRAKLVRATFSAGTMDYQGAKAASAAPSTHVQILTPSPTTTGKANTLVALWTEALATISFLLRDAVVCTCAAWLVNFLYAQGNLASRQSPAAQSYALFAVTSLFYTGFFIGIAAVAAQAASFLPLHFVQAPTAHPSFASCFVQVMKRCVWSAVLSMAGLTLAAYALSVKQLLFVHEYKLQVYVCGMFLFNFIIGVDLAGRRLYQLETIEGQTRGYVNHHSYWQRWTQLVMKNKVALCFYCFVMLYVHLTTLVDLSGLNALAFAICCIALKLAAQEVFKAYVLKQRKSSLKTMYILVAAPTVIIDTQLRIALLRSSSFASSVSLVQPLVLAGAELVVRLAKILLMHLQIKARLVKAKAQIARDNCSEQLSVSEHESSANVTTFERRRRRSNESLRVLSESRRGVERAGAFTEFRRWKARLLRFHAAETHADMYAEYIAIGCSTSIFFFFHCHPKYGSVFVAHDASGAVSSSAAAISCDSTQSSANSTFLLLRHQSGLLLLQVGLEVFIDVLCCVAELSQGISFRAARRMSVFIAGLFVFFSIVSIGVSSSFYLKSA